MTNNVAHDAPHHLARKPLQIGDVLDARTPRALICALAAVAIWFGFALGFVRGLWFADDHANSPKPVAFDVKLVRLPPPEPPPRPQPQTSRVTQAARAPQPPTAAPAGQPKPAGAARRGVASPIPAKPTPPHAIPQQATTATAAPGMAQPTQPTLPTPPAAPPTNAIPQTPPSAQATQANGPPQGAGPATPSTQSGTTSAGNGPAHAILQPLPAIPDDLREDAFQAVATARFAVHRDGSVDVELIKPTHNPRLNQLLLDALTKWRFFPAMKNGEAVESTQEIRVHVNVD
ncbi:TonB family protein [Paraburkholderia humisilvae]|uniref:TonB family protein n=1 Tax=Paraburkholderia humisilvae TaxID=627669 RepID=UPI001FE76673|nr:TonB family protein [Paraburkholderia humisilvae]